MNKMKWYVDYGTGAGNFWFDGTLDEAKSAAEDGLCYTQSSVDIMDEEYNVCARLPWWGVQPSEDDEVTACFGSFGFYGCWSDEMNIE